MDYIYIYIYIYIYYANAVFAGLPDCEISKLQRVQNIAAKFVLNRMWYDSPEQARHELHWLPDKSKDSAQGSIPHI